MNTPVDAVPVSCPLCGKQPKGKKPWRKLYSGRTCKKCYYAFLNRRQAAYLVDSLFFYVSIVFCLDYYFDLAMTVSPLATALGGSLVAIAYQIVLEAVFYCKDGFSGRSPGKWLMGVSVVDQATRQSIGLWQSFKRNLPLLIPLGALIIVFQMGKGRRMGDRWAKTRVIWTKYAHKFPFEDRENVCIQCGYNLHGNTSGICPECGITLQPPAAPVASPVVA